ncbi:putative secreted lipase [Paramyrothecium foliicola]|nr:putative secreted lipase [Paramyrothecium foliicola]
MGYSGTFRTASSILTSYSWPHVTWLAGLLATPADHPPQVTLPRLGFGRHRVDQAEAPDKSKEVTEPDLFDTHSFYLSMRSCNCIVLWIFRGMIANPSTTWKDNHGPVLDLGYATYKGTYLNNNISEFLGLRYAQPPTGQLRWRAPVDPEPIEGITRAKEFKPLCLGEWQASGKYFDEDCLYANVWAPTNATADMKLPVMVFIQGGGYTQLSNGNWNGSQLVETSGRGIVFVNFNYRVGLWGFLAGEEVRQDGDLNAGLLDQRFLLEWVQKHISKFGGDPNHVIIHGISAGAGSVAMHLASYGGRDDGLYAGAIAESVFFPAQPTVPELEYQLNRTMEEAGCSREHDRMQCLRGKSKKTLQRLNHPSPFPGQFINPFFYWTPCIDGDFLQDLPYRLFERKQFVKVPLLAGSCSNEGSIFAPHDASTVHDVVNFFKINYPGLTAADVEKLLFLYPIEPALPFHGQWYPSAARAFGESTFICPTNTVLKSYTSAMAAPAPNSGMPGSPPVWSYRYNLVDPELTAAGLGVPHVFESPAVFGPAMLPPAIVPAGYWTYNAGIVPLVMQYWLSFVMTLDPNTHRDAEAPIWEPLGATQNRLLIQLDNTSMEVVDEDEKARCDFWKDIAGDSEQ